MYEIQKAPPTYMAKQRGRKDIYPIDRLEVGEMFYAENTQSEKHSIYNVIKHRKNYTGEFKDRIFTIKTIDKDKIAVIRIK